MPDLPPHGTVQVSRAVFSSGPLPSPEVVAGYGQIDSSFPERIMAMAERQQQHRHVLEREEQQGMLELERLNLANTAARERREQRGDLVWMILGWCAVMGWLAATIFLAYTGKTTGALVSAAAGVVFTAFYRYAGPGRSVSRSNDKSSKTSSGQGAHKG